MEKAKLTKAQERALRSALITRKQDDLVREYAKAPGFFEAAYGPSASMDMDTLCRALYVGYEVIEEDQTVTVTQQMRDIISFSYNEDVGNEAIDRAYKEGVRMVLERLDIIIDGINE